MVMTENCPLSVLRVCCHILLNNLGTRCCARVGEGGVGDAEGTGGFA